MNEWMNEGEEGFLPWMRRSVTRRGRRDEGLLSAHQLQEHNCPGNLKEQGIELSIIHIICPLEKKGQNLVTLVVSGGAVGGGERADVWIKVRNPESGAKVHKRIVRALWGTRELCCHDAFDLRRCQVAARSGGEVIQLYGVNPKALSAAAEILFIPVWVRGVAHNAPQRAARAIFVFLARRIIVLRCRKMPQVPAKGLICIARGVRVFSDTVAVVLSVHQLSLKARDDEEDEGDGPNRRGGSVRK
jgi:hypothetical protein